MVGRPGLSQNRGVPGTQVLSLEGLDALIAALAWHRKEAPDARLASYLPLIEREAGKYAQQFRAKMMGEDLSPCNCAPESCSCPWGLRAARRLVGQCAIYPEVPGQPLIPEVGDEVGPLEVADCGIPHDYAIPSEPIFWGSQKGSDYYGPEGATVCPQSMYSLTEPDHELLH